MDFINFKDWDGIIQYDNLITFRMGKNRYVNCPFSFDIETSSFYEGDVKRACMYIWQVAIGEQCIYGRTWEEFKQLCEMISDALHLVDSDLILICYVHNLAYEFQWICRHFTWIHIFARTIRKVITATCSLNIEFRCSYIMSGYSLAKLAENYTPIEKLKGDLDYNLVRHSYTSLSDQELNYCYNDVKILYYWWKYIESEYIFQENGKLQKSIKIPLTQTSIVRTYCRNALNDYCKFTDGLSFKYYREIIERCSPKTEQLYNAMRYGYMGGYTHANYLFINQIIKDVTSMDFTSSYPAVMLNDYYPMSQFIKERNLDHESIRFCLDNFCCLINVAFTNLKAKKCNHIASVSKASFIGETVIEDNGRVEFANYYECWLTEKDFAAFELFYEWDEVNCIELYTATRGRLPKFIIQSLARFYTDKSELKGVKGKEIDYMHAKEQLNSLYGMLCTNILNSEIDFDGLNWVENEIDIKEQLNNHASKPSTFLLYQWGIWVSSSARFNLLSTVAKMDDDVIYCDTDSIKFINAEKNQYIFDEYNEEIYKKNKDACDYYDLDYNLFKTIGEWSYDGHYDNFITLGAKKYASDHHITVSGLNSKTAIKWIEENNGNILDYFKIGQVFPNGASGRSVHTYMDEEFETVVSDYTGIPATVSEKSYIHMEETSYTLGLYWKFSEYLHLKGYRR